MFRDVALDQVSYEKVTVSLLSYLREYIEVLVSDLAVLGYTALNLHSLHIDHVVELRRVFECHLYEQTALNHEAHQDVEEGGRNGIEGEGEIEVDEGSYNNDEGADEHE